MTSQGRFFVTGTGTGVGKTFVTASLIRATRHEQRTVAAFKPLMSGYAPADPATSDAGVLSAALGRPLRPPAEDDGSSLAALEALSPWRWEAARAPSMAARAAGARSLAATRPLIVRELLAWCRRALEGPEDVVLLESLGGIMSPITDNATVLDWAEGLRIPLLLVTDSFVGSLSPTLTALEVLRARDVPLAAVVVNDVPGRSLPLPAEVTVQELRRYTPFETPFFTTRAFLTAWPRQADKGLKKA